MRLVPISLLISFLGCGGRTLEDLSPPEPTARDLDAATFDVEVSARAPDVDAPEASSDGGVDATPPQACTPRDGGFVPQWRPPRVLQGACSASQIAAYQACIHDAQTQADPASCARFRAPAESAEDKRCEDCIMTDPASPAYGPLIGYPTFTIPNAGGCLALESGDLSGAGCPGSLLARDECVGDACGACAYDDVASCETKANACNAPNMDTSCANHSGSPCADWLQFDRWYDYAVPLFCGAGNDR